MSEESSAKGLTRRDFLKGIAIGTTAVAAGTTLSSFTGMAADVSDTVTSDVVVIGAGQAGMSAAVSAAESGADTVLLEKTSSFSKRGHHHGVSGSKLHDEMGIDIPKDESVARFMKFSGEKVDQRLVNLWYERSPEAANWAIDKAESAGVEVDVDTGLIGFTDHELFKHYRTSLTFDGWMNRLVDTLESSAQDNGVDIRYDTPAVQLVRENGGRVTGVVAKTGDSSHVRFDANKAVILCTGGYANNRDMLEEYCPSALWASEFWYQGPNTGDGHQMGMDIGAAIDDHHPTVMHATSGVYDDPQANVPFYATAFLEVDQNGRRFHNENQPLGLTATARINQPGHCSWQVWDGNWPEEAPHMGQGFGRVTEVTEDVHQRLEEAVQSGAVQKADSLAALAKKMGVPADTLEATVERYNELAERGKDVDFGKEMDRMPPCDTPPFYAARRGAALLVTLGGLKVNDELQVMDPDWNPIPGLYAAGNVSGRFFANDYPMIFSGLSHGRALTFGYLAGRKSAEE